MRPIQSKSQSSMEFLLTYAWAALIIIVIAASLAYFGVMGNNKDSGTCIFPAGFDCADNPVINKGSPGTIILSFRNNIGIINLTNSFSATECAETTVTSVNGDTQFPVTVGREEIAIITVPCTTEKTRFKTKITFNYVNTESQLPNTLSGEFTGRAK